MLPIYIHGDFSLRRSVPAPFCIFPVLRPLVLPYLLYLAKPLLTTSCSAFKHLCFPDIQRYLDVTNPLVGLLLPDPFSAPTSSPFLLHSLYFPHRYFLPRIWARAFLCILQYFVFFHSPAPQSHRVG